MSSRIEGFEIMDVSTSLPNDPKVKRLAREHPDLLGPGFLVYVSTMAESWKAGERVTFDDAWPSYLVFDQAIVDALTHVRLLDSTGRVTTSAWRGYFVQARNRRQKSRDRWRRANDARAGKGASLNGTHHADTARSPRGASDATAANPSDSESVEESTPPTPSPARGRTRRRAGADDPRFAQYDEGLQRDDDAPDWLGRDR